MRFLCLVHVDEADFADFKPEDHARLINTTLDYDDELRRRGHFVFASPIEPVEKGVTVRVRNGRLSKTDGPFAETKEHLGGFLIIEAEDLEEAAALMAKDPMAAHATMEIHALRPLERIPA